MSIVFFNLLDGEDWVPLSVDPTAPAEHWVDGSPLASAPVDVAATFDGHMWHSSKIDPSFHLDAVRCDAGFTVPRRHLSQRRLVIVIGGDLMVQAGSGDARRIAANQFFVVGAGTPFTTTAGSGGVVYLESSPQPYAPFETYWHPGDGWQRSQIDE